MALSFHTTTTPLFGHRLPAPDMSDDVVHSEVTDALLGFVYDPLDASNNTALDDLLSLPPATTGAEWRCGKRQRIVGTGSQQVPAALAGAGALMNDEFVLQLPPVFVRGADANKAGGGGAGACHQSVQQNSAARQRRKRISDKTAELARLIPGAHKLNTAEMLEEAARHVRLLQAQVGVLALMRAAGTGEEEEKMPSAMAQERMHALLACGNVQERLAAAGKCLVPRTLVDAVAKDDAAVMANPVVRRDLGRFVASLKGQ